MQKKIYSLLLVPCSLVACLALAFLVSCGDTGGGSTGQETPPPGPPPPSQTCKETNTCAKEIHIILEEPAFTIEGDQKLFVKGRIDLFLEDDDPAYISSIIIKMTNMDIGGEKTIMSIQGENYGTSYDLPNGQGSGFDFKPCELNKYKQEIHIIAYINNGSLRDTTFTFKETHPDCQTYGLETGVSPSGAGSVSASLQGPYLKDQLVTLTATPANSGFTFSNWTDKWGGLVSDANPYEITINGDEKFTANFIEGRSLVMDRQVELKVGEPPIQLGIVSNAISYVLSGGNKLKAVSGVELIEEFLLPNGSKAELTEDDVTSPSKTNEFTVAPNSSMSEVEYTPGKYYVATTGSGWGNWFLLRGEPKQGCAANGTATGCIWLTVWKVQ